MKSSRIIVVSILLSLLLGFIYLRFDRFRLIQCLKDVERQREEVIAQGELNTDRIISIEQTMDKKRDECYVLYK